MRGFPLGVSAGCEFRQSRVGFGLRTKEISRASCFTGTAQFRLCLRYANQYVGRAVAQGSVTGERGHLVGSSMLDSYGFFFFSKSTVKVKRRRMHCRLRPEPDRQRWTMVIRVAEEPMEADLDSSGESRRGRGPACWHCTWAIDSLVPALGPHLVAFSPATPLCWPGC